MGQFDAILKLLLQSSASSVVQRLTGIKIVQWLNVELPKVETTRADLLGITAADQLVHVEVQSFNDTTMCLRMAEYALRIHANTASIRGRLFCMWDRL